MAHMSSDALVRNMDILSQNGVSTENIIDNMNAMDIVDNLDTLKKQGVNFEDDYAEYYH